MEQVDGFREVEAGGETIAVQYNNLTANEYCVLCDRPHKDADVPYWFFVKDSTATVCEQCMHSIAPELLQEVRAANHEVFEHRNRPQPDNEEEEE